jgi:hypothetical protein
MDRLARNLNDLPRTHPRMEFIKEHLAFTGEDRPTAHLTLSVMAAWAHFGIFLTHSPCRRAGA